MSSNRTPEATPRPSNDFQMFKTTGHCDAFDLAQSRSAYNANEACLVLIYPAKIMTSLVRTMCMTQKVSPLQASFQGSKQRRCNAEAWRLLNPNSCDWRNL